MPQHDQLHRYLFENFAVRGELVTVSETLQQILENHTYPQPVKNVLAELLVATSLLTATLKFAGDITVQLQGDGPLSPPSLTATTISRCAAWPVCRAISLKALISKRW